MYSDGTNAVITATGILDLTGVTGGVSIDEAVVNNSLEIPNGTAPSLTADGQIALETDQNALVMQLGDGTTIGANTDVSIPVIYHKGATIVQPDQVQSEKDNVMFMSVESPDMPNGIKIVKIKLTTDAASSTTVNVEEWTSPTDGSPSTIDTISTSSSSEQTETTITDPDVAAGSIIMLDLDTTDISWLNVEIWYYIKD